MIKLIPPYGGRLVNLVAEGEARLTLIDKAKHLPSVQLSPRSVSDLELLATGAFSPLDRFMRLKDYRSVLSDMRLSDGTLFPIPITLTADPAPGLTVGGEITLCGPTNEILAIMLLEEIYPWNRDHECSAVLGTSTPNHPFVSEMHSWGRYCISGELKVLNVPRHYDFPRLRKTPAEVRSLLEQMERENVIAYQPRHAMHRAHEAFTKNVIDEVNGSLLVQPAVGVTRYGDTEHFTRVRCYQSLIENYYKPERTLLNLIPLAPRAAGARAGLWHGVINRNYGVNHMIIGRDPHALDADSRDNFLYDTSDVQKSFREHERELGVTMIPHREMVYLPQKKRYMDAERAVSVQEPFVKLAGTDKLEKMLHTGKTLPGWFTYPEIARVLSDAIPPKSRRGFCIWLTGLPSSGKSTIADILAQFFLARGKKATLLDGDVVRTYLTKGLGFSKEDRIVNIVRVGFVASEIVRHEGIVVCALISPFESARNKVRSMIGEDKFIEVFVDTPVEVCEKRDVKGMYAKAKKGTLRGFTGVDDVYEQPQNPDLRIQTVNAMPQESAEVIMRFLAEKGYLGEQKKAMRRSEKSIVTARAC